jgi:hypothetical protein
MSRSGWIAIALCFVVLVALTRTGWIPHWWDLRAQLANVPMPATYTFSGEETSGGKPAFFGDSPEISWKFEAKGDLQGTCRELEDIAESIAEKIAYEERITTEPHGCWISFRRPPGAIAWLLGAKSYYMGTSVWREEAGSVVVALKIRDHG